MANSFDSNFSRKLMRAFLKKFESQRVLTKTIDTQLFDGKFEPSSGDNVDVKRPHDYYSIRTSGGDISSSTKPNIISGKATATVQDYFTVPLEWTNKQEALEMDQLEEIVAPAATRMITDLETSLGQYMLKNTNLRYGTPGTAVDAWGDVAGAQALMESTGVPADMDWYYVMNPYTRVNLAGVQNSLNTSSELVKSAWERAVISADFGGMKAMSSNSLATYTTGANGDLVGALASAPTATYLAHKDTMIQNLAVTGFGAGGVVTAGTQIEVTGRFRLNISTKEKIYDGSGSNVKWTGTVTEDVTLDSSGAGTLKVAGPAIYEANGAYNTVDSALDTGDVVTILGTASTGYQPNLFYHKQAFTMATVKLPKLYSTDTVATTSDGISIRVSKYADGDANGQRIRFDLLPAFGTMNPFFAGHGYGAA